MTGQDTNELVEALVPSVSIQNFLAQRDAMVERARKAQALLGEIEDLAKTMELPYSSSHLALSMHTRGGRYGCEFVGHLDEYIRIIDASCWEKLFSLSGLSTFMDAEARDKWATDINKGDVPPLTLENIATTFAALHASRGEMFERGIVKLFQRLSWDYKTNNPVMLGKRIIMRVLDSMRYGVYLSSGYSDKLDDIMRVMRILDGKPELDHRQGAYHRLSEAGWPRELRPVSFDGYFLIKGFQNGNGHITFLRADIVDRMNQIIAKHYPGALPPVREEKIK